MIRTLFLLFFTNLLLLANQDKFFIVLPKPFDSILYDVVQDYDDTVSAVGFANQYKKTKHKKVYSSAFEYLSDASDNLYGKKPILVTVDRFGSIAQEKFARIKDFSIAVAVEKTPQNGYFVGGYTYNGSLLLAKLDSFGNTIFVRKFGTKNYDRMNNLIKLSDGGVLAIGNSTTSRDLFDPMFQTGLGLNDIFITRFDSDGKMLWSKKYGTQYDDMGIDAVEAYDGSIVVLAATTYDKHKDITLMRIGENGDKIWLRHFKSDTFQIPKKLIRLRDNNFIALIDQQDELGKDQIKLIKFDLQKNLLLNSIVATYYPSILNDIKEYANSTLIGVGQVKDRFNTDALVIILDENLEVLCQEHFGQDSYDLFHSVAILRDSNAMAVGLTTPKGKQVHNMLFAKIKQDCTLAPKPQQSKNSQKQENSFLSSTKVRTSLDLSSFNTNINSKNNTRSSFVVDSKYTKNLKQHLFHELLRVFDQEIKHHKVSISQDLEITFIAKDLYFAQGVYQLTPKQKKFLDHFMKKLFVVLQKYKKNIKTLEIIGHTSSEWSSKDSFTKRYLKNQDLSLKRSYSVSSYIFTTASKEQQKFLAKILKDSGWSFSKKVQKGSKEDKRHSRRVSFKIILKNTL